jgi:hypothetical protein
MNGKTFGRILPPACALFAVVSAQVPKNEHAAAAASPSIGVPKAWNDRELRDWATPLPSLGSRPGFYSEADMDTVATQTLYRSYPAYHPDREPAGYWEWLQKQPPRPLVDVANLRTDSDWIKAGRVVFHELYRGDPRRNADLIPQVRSRSALKQADIDTFPDGTLPVLWVVTPEGVFPASKTCQTCHMRYMPDGTAIDGAASPNQGLGIERLRAAPAGGQFGGRSTDELRMRAFQEFSMPWVKDDIHNAIKTMTRPDLEEMLSIESRYGSAVMPRGGSGFFPTKAVDLNGVRDRKYLNHTATHVNRGIGDIMRYTLHITCCGDAIYGSYRTRPGLPPSRYPDDVLFALAKYIYSLDAPLSPYRDDPNALTGKQIFEREGCATCHAPPLYTNNKLTLAKGFKPAVDHPYTTDIMSLSVGTDPGRAMETRVGTGFYRVPSLRGVWYRNLFGHQGDVATLEEWFDPARLRDDYVPSGWKGFNRTSRSVPGHEFGLTLTTTDKRALIAFLKTL